MMLRRGSRWVRYGDCRPAGGAYCWRLTRKTTAPRLVLYKPTTAISDQPVWRDLATRSDDVACQDDDLWYPVLPPPALVAVVR